MVLSWVRISEDHYRSDCSRFDLWLAYAFGHWVCVDADTGRVCRSTRQACERWCERQLEASRGNP